MRKIELVSWKDVPRRLESIKISLETIYGVELGVESRDVPLNWLYPTERFLEKDKLALILMKIMTEGYDVPIVAVKHNNDYFILDGHHRSSIWRKMGERTIRAHALIFPESKSYRTQPKHPLEDLPIREVAAIDDPILKTWTQIPTLLRYFEALYNVSFGLRKEDVPLEDLVPTQSETGRRQIDSIKERLVPIVCIRSGGKFYILDGHARSLRARQLGSKSIEAVILSPEGQVDFGIVKVAKEMGPKGLDDIKIAD